ncbi:MAG: GTP cyclohydrolase II [Microcystis aeruginosa Ma_MB_F_20061100_S19]|nr:MAG: GTP cyclohydrolase II [Microcystis aeruginosa Ma_MB_F_20061100_S19]
MTNIIKISSSILPTEFGNFMIHIFRDNLTNVDHVAMTIGQLKQRHNVLTRVHSECLTGDVFSSTRCDCGSQLKYAQEAIARKGEGVVIYLRDHEGRGIGLANKISAYALQDKGLDTVDANLALGLPIDQRTFGVAAEILKSLEILSIDLLSNNPSKHKALVNLKIDVRTVSPINIAPNKHNFRYLETKRLKLGHLNSIPFS